MSILKFDILEDESLQNVINILISSLLPHKKYNASEFSTNLNSLLRYVKLEEFSMEYYVLVSLLCQLNSIMITTKGFVPNLTKQALEFFMEKSLEDSITNPSIQMKEWLSYQGMDNNLTVATIKVEACQKLYARTVELYDTCFALEQDSDTVLDFMPSLRAAFIAHVSMNSLNAQGKILQDKLYVGRKVFSGSIDWLEYTKALAAEVNNRVTEASTDNTLCVNDIAKSDRLLASLSEMFIPIAPFNIPEIDGDSSTVGTPLMRHRLVVVVGPENIGKSMMAKDLATNAMIAGKRVLYMCGENTKDKMYYEILIGYIYKKYHYMVQINHLRNLDECPENIQAIINMSIAEITENKLLVLKDCYNYDTVESELVSDYNSYKPDVYFIDHSCALVGGEAGDTRANVEMLSTAAKNFRKDYPVCVVILSHPSAGAKDAIAKDKPIASGISPTRGSQALSTDADDVYVMRTNTILQKQHLIQLENTKRRDANVITTPVVLRTMYHVHHLEYDPVYQTTATDLNVSADLAVEALADLYSDNDEYNL